ncbi:hypothetical protein KR222_007552, partial [Zaprionus bogoriensis]
VPTSYNPADILSMGALPSELLASTLWFSGPNFLIEWQDAWPQSCLPEKMLPELKKSVLVDIRAFVDVPGGCKFANSWEKLKRVFAFIYKFRNRVRHPELTVEHIKKGSYLLLRAIQMSCFADEYQSLKGSKTLKSTGAIVSLNPFLDEFGVMRVGGRLRNSTLDFEAQHPIIFPRQHPVTRAIIMHAHQRNLHAGPRALLAHIRLQYWPIGGRKTVSSVVSKCIICFKAKPRLVEHMMADLPKDRVSATSTFMVTGLDFCGPFHYKSEIRNRAPIKTYICVFICFATKAVHLELAQDLSTPTFLSALKRF